jgi:hypothetical protein
LRTLSLLDILGEKFKLDKLNFEISSLMICEAPALWQHGLLLSSSADVWHPRQDLTPYQNLITDRYLEPLSLDTDERVLQMYSRLLLSKVNELGDYICFRKTPIQYMDQLQVYPSRALYESISEDLVFLGWDVCDLLGISASIHAIFPPILNFSNNTLKVEITKPKEINFFGLIDHLDIALNYCSMNNLSNSNHRPWIPVGVSVDKFTYARLLQMQEA